jgi:hypothetical protein
MFEGGGGWNDLKTNKTLRKQLDFLIKANTSEKMADNEDLCALSYAYESFQLNYQLDRCCSGDPLLDERNAAWLRQLPDLLDEKKLFIAVGLFHLYFECGLITQLRNLGYRVTAVEL